MKSNDVAMTFLEHLGELRRRIIISLITFGVFTVIGMTFNKPILYILELPMRSPFTNFLADAIELRAGSEGSTLGFLSLTLRSESSSPEAEIVTTGAMQIIMSYLTIGITTGIILSLPVILFQIWMFIFPALNSNERRIALPLFFTIIFFFLLGAIFAYLIVVPVVLQFAAGIFPDYRNLWDLKTYLSFVTGLILGFGIAFELPVVMAFLARIGIIDSRGFRSKQRLAIMGIFVMSAMLTPADPGSMLLMAIPLLVLYQLGIFFAFLVEKEVEI